MYVPGTDHPAWLVLVISVVFMVVIYAFAATLPLLTGLACGWRMRAISPLSGLMVGLAVGAVAFLLSLAAILVQAPSLALVVLPVSAGTTWLLCWRMSRKKG